jgi:nucleotide-binding universal stress UspA family protein
MLLAGEPVAEVGQRLLRAVSSEFGSLAGERIDYEQLFETGDPARVLVDVSKDADLVVLAHRTSLRGELRCVGNHGRC